MMFYKNKGRLCTCRYRVDDTGDCLLDMLITSQLAEDGESWGDPEPDELTVLGVVDGNVS